MKSIPGFLAHALILEEKSAQQYEHLAQLLEQAPAAAEGSNGTADGTVSAVTLFRTMAGHSRTHLAQAQKMSTGLQLPPAESLQPEWDEEDGPEAIPAEDVHPGMTPLQALKAALMAEIRAQDFYAGVARNDRLDPELRTIAATFAVEEGEHIDLLQQWLQEHPAS